MESLTVPGTIDSLGAIAEYVKQVATIADLNRKDAYKLRLAVDEVATNIITHGYEEAGRLGNIYLSADLDPSHLTLTVEDTGIIYNPTDKATLNKEYLSQTLETRQVGGLGIHLVLESMDEFRYERQGDRNRNIFIMHRHQ